MQTIMDQGALWGSPRVAFEGPLAGSLEGSLATHLDLRVAWGLIKTTVGLMCNAFCINCDMLLWVCCFCDILGPPEPPGSSSRPDESSIFKNAQESRMDIKICPQGLQIHIPGALLGPSGTPSGHCGPKNVAKTTPSNARSNARSNAT